MSATIQGVWTVCVWHSDFQGAVAVVCQPPLFHSSHLFLLLPCSFSFRPTMK